MEEWFAFSWLLRSVANGDAIPSNLSVRGMVDVTAVRDCEIVPNVSKSVFARIFDCTAGDHERSLKSMQRWSLASYSNGRLGHWINDHAHGFEAEQWRRQWCHGVVVSWKARLVMNVHTQSRSEWFNNGVTSPNGFDAFPGGQRMNAGNFKAQAPMPFEWTSTALSSMV